MWFLSHSHPDYVVFISLSHPVYVSEDTTEEPDFTYIPDTHQIASSSSANTLQSSLMLLGESLESGAAIAQFEVGL